MKLRVRELRKSLGLTQNEFAKRANVTQPLINSYEKDGRNPSLLKIEQIAEAYNVSPSWLVGWDQIDNIPVSKTVVKEKIVYVENTAARIPNEYRAVSRNIISWKE